VIGVIALRWKDLLLHAFDPVLARTIGLPTRLLHYGLLALLSLTIVAALKAVGIILAIALLIAPGAIALLTTRSFGRMLAVAVSVSVAAAVAGVRPRPLSCFCLLHSHVYSPMLHGAARGFPPHAGGTGLSSLIPTIKKGPVRHGSPNVPQPDR
jgi:hypothetical protein